MAPIREFTVRNWTLTFLLLLFATLMLIHPVPPSRLPHYMDYRTLMSLVGLLVITKGLELSGFFNRIADSWVQRARDERQLALLLILLTALLSPILTNDVALFITVPLTLSFQRLLRNDLDKIIVFQALAANAGSSLTPIGNPQNLYIWHTWDIPFVAYTMHMGPVFLVSTGLLILMSIVAFPRRKLRLKASRTSPTSIPLLITSMLMLILFIVAMERDWIWQGVVAIIIVYLLLRKEAITRADWGIILIIALMFVDFNILAGMDAFRNLVKELSLGTHRGVMLSSAMVSQVISNVPSAILLSTFTDDYGALSWGVNAGGNGLLIASLANIIALRMAGSRRSYLTFHLYSIPFFLITIVILSFLIG